jgi:RNA polymerase sigma-70 factor, ECF subfamily
MLTIYLFKSKLKKNTPPDKKAAKVNVNLLKSKPDTKADKPTGTKRKESKTAKEIREMGQSGKKSSARLDLKKETEQAPLMKLNKAALAKTPSVKTTGIKAPNLKVSAPKTITLKTPTAKVTAAKAPTAKTPVVKVATAKVAAAKVPLKKSVEDEPDYEKLDAMSDEEMLLAEARVHHKSDTKITRAEIERQLSFKKEAMIHIDALYNFAVRMTGDAEDANDLVQETYMKAYRFFDSFEKGTNCKAWLFRILKNSYINKYRKESKEPDKVDYEDIKDFFHTVKHSSLDSNDMQEKMYGDLLDDEVSRALDGLPEDFREVVQLCDIEGFTYEEIANMVDCPIGTVRSRLHRGRKILRDKLIEYARHHGYKANPEDWADDD